MDTFQKDITDKASKKLKLKWFISNKLFEIRGPLKTLGWQEYKFLCSQIVQKKCLILGGLRTFSGQK